MSTNTGTRPFCRIGIDGRGKSGGHGDYLVAGAQRPIAQLLGSKASQGKQRGRRAGIYQHGMAQSAPGGEGFLEFEGEPAGGEPEIQRGLGQVDQFIGVENTARVRDRRAVRHKRFLRKGLGMVLPHKAQDLLPQLIGW